MIYDEVCRAFWVDQAGVHTMFGHSVPHGCQIHHGRNATVKENSNIWPSFKNLQGSRIVKQTTYIFIGITYKKRKNEPSYVLLSVELQLLIILDSFINQLMWYEILFTSVRDDEDDCTWDHDFILFFSQKYLKTFRTKTHVKSWRRTRAGENGTSALFCWCCQSRIFWTSSSLV